MGLVCVLVCVLVCGIGVWDWCVWSPKTSVCVSQDGLEIHAWNKVCMHSNSVHAGSGYGILCHTL